MYIISKIPYKTYKKFDKVAYFVSIVLLLSVLIPGLGLSEGEATRWIYIKPLHITFQPSEIVKVALVIFFASYLTDNREKIGNLWEGFFRPIILYLLPVILILYFVQSHLSACILIGAVITIMMLVAGSKFRYFLGFGSIGAALAGRWYISYGKVYSKGRIYDKQSNVIFRPMG